MPPLQKIKKRKKKEKKKKEDEEGQMPNKAKSCFLNHRNIKQPKAILKIIIKKKKTSNVKPTCNLRMDIFVIQPSYFSH